MTLQGAVAETLTTLHQFAGRADGAYPEAQLIREDSVLYGTTYQGGHSSCSGGSCGTVFKVDIETGRESVLHAFANSPDGAYPRSSLLIRGSTLYGTTEMGGARHVGTVFAIDARSGDERVLHSFNGRAQGGNPWAGLTGRGAMLYGTATLHSGTVFSFDLDTKAFDVLLRFDTRNGALPLAGVLDRHGTLYGATYEGGRSSGTIYTLNTRTGEATTLYNFAGGDDGGGPAGVTYLDGVLYGTTFRGGDMASCADGCGTVFQIDLKTGVESVLYAFHGGADGQSPQSGLVAVGHAMYGTNRGGSQGCEGNGCGTVFKIDTRTGEHHVVYSFTGGDDGGLPLAALTYVNGMLYGTTALGGSPDCNCGTVFKLVP